MREPRMTRITRIYRIQTCLPTKTRERTRKSESKHFFFRVDSDFRRLVSVRTDPRTTGELFNNVARRPSFIVADATGGVSKCFFLGREKRFEAAFVDRFHECFM